MSSLRSYRRRYSGKEISEVILQDLFTLVLSVLCLWGITHMLDFGLNFCELVFTTLLFRIAVILTRSND